MNVFLATLLLAITTQAAPFSLTNMGPEFRVYVETYKGQDAEAQWQGWINFHDKYAELHNLSLCDLKTQKCEAKLKSRLGKFFAELPQFESQMWSIFDQAEQIAATQTSRFKTAFPNLADNVQVVFMPSMGAFNGRAVSTGQRAILFIGADLVASKKDNIDVLFSHEFFHAYQLDMIMSKKNFQTIASPLWFEGLGTWVSGKLNPNASLTDILMDSDLAKFCEPVAVSLMAREYRDLMRESLTKEDSDKVNLDWFNMAGSRPGPKRQGYCLGNFMIETAIKKHTLAEIVVMSEDQFHPIVLEALETLTK